MEISMKTILHYHTIGSAIILAATFIGCALIFKESYNQISVLLNCAGAMQLIIWSSLIARLKKQVGDKVNS